MTERIKNSDNSSDEYQIGAFLSNLSACCKHILYNAGIESRGKTAICIGIIKEKKEDKPLINELVIISDQGKQIELTSRGSYNNKTKSFDAQISYLVEPYSTVPIKIISSKCGKVTHRKLSDTTKQEKSRFYTLSWTLAHLPQNRLLISRFNLKTNGANDMPELLGEVNPKSNENIWGKKIGNEDNIIFKDVLQI